MSFLRNQYNLLRIVDMEVLCIVGILPQERSKPQRLFINAELDVDFDDAKASGSSLIDGVDYGRVAELLKETIVRQKFLLLEDLLKVCCQVCFDEFLGLNGMMLRASKPDIISNCARVEAEISLSRPKT